MIRNACNWSLRGLVFGLMVVSAQAASFTINSTSSTNQTLSAGQTGNITSSGNLSISGTTIAITITGNSSVTNNGTILQTGTGRALRDNTGNLTFTLTNGSASNSSALIKTFGNDVIQMAQPSSNVTILNYGTLQTVAASSQVVNLKAITTGNNTVTNYSTGQILAAEADAIRPGVNGVVNNFGTVKGLTSNGSSSDGVDVQNNTGVNVTNSGLIEGGRHGITGGAANATVTFFTTTVTNNSGGTIQGDNGSGINLDGFNGNHTATITNNGTIIGNGRDISNGVSHDGDGIDVDGLVTVTNTGIIRSVNSFNIVADGVAHSEGITVGGGTITNSGTIEGLVASGNTNAIGFGITLLGNDILTGPLAGTREGIYGNATVTNQSGGLIRGDSASGIMVDGAATAYTVTINNNAGATIRGGATLAGLGGTLAAIAGGPNTITINNAGLIDGSSNGKAVTGGNGSLTLNVTGGSAQILGDMDGGASGNSTLNVSAGSGGTLSYNGSITNFSTINVQSGTFSLSGSLSGGNVTITGGTLNYTGSAQLANAVTVNGGEFKNNSGNFTGTLSLVSGKISGSGAINSALTFGAGTVLSPGNSPGSQSYGAVQTWANGGTYIWEINNVNGSAGSDPGWDTETITAGGLVITADATTKFTIDINGLALTNAAGVVTGWSSTGSYVWTIATVTGGITGFDASKFTLLTSNFTNFNAIASGYGFSIQSDGSTVQLVYGAVPEPSTFAMLALLGLPLLAWRRRARA